MGHGRGRRIWRGLSRSFALFGALRTRRGNSALAAVFILFFAAAALLFYFRKEILNKNGPVAATALTVPEDSGTAAVFVREIVPAPEGSSPAAGESGVAPPGVPAAAQTAMDQGEPERAIALLRLELESSPGSRLLTEALAAALNAAGLDEFKTGGYGAAEELFDEAVNLRGADTYVKNLAAVKLKLGDDEGAAELLAPFGHDPLIRPVLKGIYVRLGNEAALRGDVEAASMNYGKGARLDPEDKELKEALKRFDKESSVEAGMGTRDGGHFIVKYEGGENAAAGYLIGMLLEEAYMKVGADLDYYPDDTVTALLYSRERFRDITRSPAWTGGIYDGRIKLPAGGIYDKTEELERVVFHEYTHAVVHRLSGGRAPVWLNEGLAMYEEGYRAGDYAANLRALAATGKIALAPLEGSFMGLDAEGAQVAYLLSLSAAEHVIKEFGIFSVRRVLENLGAGMGLEEAVSSALFLSYGELERSWLKSLERL